MFSNRSRSRALITTRRLRSKPLFRREDTLWGRKKFLSLISISQILLYGNLSRLLEMKKRRRDALLIRRG
jgi:hypothetical protein